jgi:hypothetical protein
LPHTQQSSQENKVSRKFEGPNAVMDSIILWRRSALVIRAGQKEGSTVGNESAESWYSNVP